MVKALFALGMCSTSRAQIFVIYLYESLQRHHYPRIFTFANCMEGLFGLLGSLYFLYLSKNCFWLIAIAYTFQVVATLGVFFLPESPKFLISRGEYEKASLSFQTIALWNKQDPKEVSVEKVR